MSLSLPASIGNLTRLKNLFISQNNLTILPEETGNLVLLQNLDLSSNKLSSLPESFGKLSELRNLFLYSNYLKTLPSSFSQLANLRILNLRSNQLIGLPGGIGNCSLLDSLYLEDNRITAIPSEIGNLTKLQILTLTQNSIDSLPNSIGSLTDLPLSIINLTPDFNCDFSQNRLDTTILSDTLIPWLSTYAPDWYTTQVTAINHTNPTPGMPVLSLTYNIRSSFFTFTVPVSGIAQLYVYDCKGRKIATLFDSYLSAGRYVQHWNRDKSSAGVYVLKLLTKNNSISRKVILTQ